MSGFKLNRRRFLALGATISAYARLGWAAHEPADSSLLSSRIPSTGELIPVIGIGTNRWVSDGPADEQAALRATLKLFFDLGGRVIDTAPLYRSSETALGKLISELGVRDAFFLATKIDRKESDEARAQLARSFDYLQTGKLDLLQVHNLRGAAGLLDDMLAWREEGLIRYVGITTSRLSQFAEMEQLMREFPLDFVQLNYSLIERDAEERLLPLAIDRDIAVLVNRPFARGQLFKTTRDKPLPEWAQEISCASWAQFALKFVISHPAVTCAIPGMSKSAHVQDNLHAARDTLPDSRQRQQQAEEFAALV